jgi:A/G-specific adenine glycosylase
MLRYPDLPTAAFARPLRRRLVAWFRSAQRDLPWRRDRDPYRIWVSEIMLQQTTVAAVIPYYHRFLEAFPTVAALAAATEQEVLRQWEGLGYYRRARHMYRAAQELVSRHGGQVPRDPVALAALPGIGRYTHGAILSQAFDERLPIVEANSQRVLCRWFACRDDPRSADVQRWLWQTAEALLPQRGAGEFNQALMELGALVCTPTQPSCLLCPVSSLCAARAQGLEEKLPAKAKPVRATLVREVAVVVRKSQLVLLVQRPNDASRWAGMWEFPHEPLSDDETAPAGAERILHELTGLRAAIDASVLTLKHGITRYVITMECVLAKYRSGRFRSPFYARARWTTLDKLHVYPLSSPQRRLAEMLSKLLRRS